MTYIIHGATGAQGAPVLNALTASGQVGVAAVRDADAFPGEAVRVDYRSVDSLTAAYAGVDGVFVHLPVGSADEQLAHAAAIGEAVLRSRPRRVVFSTSGYTLGGPGSVSSPADVMAGLLADSGVSFAVVEPRLFLENLLLPVVVGPVRDEGVLRYPLRDDYATSWSSHLDVADAAVRLLIDPTVSGTVAVGALPGLLGRDLAAGFAAHFGRDVVYEALDPELFGKLIEPMFGPEAARPIVDSYAWRSTQPGEVIPEARSAQNLLDLSPRTVRQWLAAVL